MKRLFKLENLNTKQKILTGVLAPMILLVILGGISIFNINSITHTNQWVEHTHKVLAESNAIVSSAVDMETGMRGYLLAGKDGFLDPYKGGEQSTYAGLEELKATVSDNPTQVQRLNEAENILKEWQMNVTEPTIQLRRDIGNAETMNDMSALVGEARGKAFFDKFRDQISTFINRESALLTKRRADFEAASKSLNKIFAQQAQTNTTATTDLLGVMAENEAWVTHTYNVIAQANDILSAAVDMETGMRGYLLAGKEEFLAPYNNGSEKFFNLTDSLAKTVSDNNAQVQLLMEIQGTITNWKQEVTEPMIELRRQIGAAKTMDNMADLVGEARGKQYFDQFRQIMSDFNADERVLMEQRQEANASTVTSTYIMIAACIVVALIIGFILAWFIGNGIANPLIKMTTTMGILAKGDNTVDVPGVGRVDEIGQMAEAVLVFRDNAIETERLQVEQKQAEQQAEKQKEEQRKATEAERIETAKTAEAERKASLEQLANRFQQSVGTIVSTVSGAATKMQATAEIMAKSSDESTSVVSSMAEGTKEASSNVQSVAGAAEELSASITEISQQVSQSASITTRAVSQAEATNATVKGLSAAAKEIGEVVDLINDIATQTNLLALNATIEAARAGDAGKGFAVVASEVKNLASQTGRATEEIASQIASMQGVTNETVGAIEDIGKTISEVNEIANGIAAAVEEQGAATQEIARNVQKAANGTQNVTENIADVQQAVDQSGKSASEVLTSAEEMANQSDLLSKEVNNFLDEVRSA